MPMFGLMRSCGCGTSPEARQLRQLQYCGTCKTMGRLFGQRARLTLNHDAVFLGELLLALDKISLPPSFTSRRCFLLPMATEIPRPLAYAAAANVVLAEFAMRDKLTDREGRCWELAERGLAVAITKAHEVLRGSRVPLDTLFAQHEAQASVEANPTTLVALATPTGVATRLIFAHGNAAHADSLGLLGEAFGRLIYTLDAIHDLADDLKRGAFNALTATQTTVKEACAYIQALQTHIIQALAALPLSQADCHRFTLQLQSSVHRALMSAQEQRQRPHYQPPQPKTCACCRCTGQDVCDTCTCLSCDCTCSCCGDICTDLACEGCCSACGDCGGGACCCPSL